MSASAIIDFNGLLLNNFTADADGNKWYGSLDRSGARPMVNSTQRVGAHGTRYNYGFYGPRSLVLSGQVTGPNLDALKLAEFKLRSYANMVTSLGSITRYDVTVARQAYVHLADDVLFKIQPNPPLNGATLATFEVPMMMPDPRWYTLTESSQALAGTAVVGGTFPTPPRLQVTGTAAGPIAVTLAGRTVQINTSLGSGQLLVVDFNANTITKAGAALYSSVAQLQWFDLVPGNNVLTYSGGGTPVIYWRNAWA